jgi:hypothetical protein
MLLEGHIETINFQENVDLQVTLVSIRRENTAYSTNGLLLKQAVRWLEIKHE